MNKACKNISCHSLNHIAFILDGNRRWAHTQGIPTLSGHKSGYERVKEITRVIPKYGIRYVTYYVFSTENWKRSCEEIDYLMKLFRDFFSRASDYMMENDIKVIAIGDLGKFPTDICEAVKDLEKTTQKNSTLTLVLAINYGGRDEIIRSVKKIVHDVMNHKCCSDVDEKMFASYLDTNGIPDPDLVVRTCEKRMSNFLVWQSAYSEIFFVDKFWPDFNVEDLENIISEFMQRERRYGK